MKESTLINSIIWTYLFTKGLLLSSTLCLIFNYIPSIYSIPALTLLFALFGHIRLTKYIPIRCLQDLYGLQPVLPEKPITEEFFCKRN